MILSKLFQNNIMFELKRRVRVNESIEIYYWTGLHFEMFIKIRSLYKKLNVLVYLW